MVKQNIKRILLIVILAGIISVAVGWLILTYLPDRTYYGRKYEFAQPEDQIKTIEVVYIYPFWNAPGKEVEVVYTVTEIVNSDPQKFLEGLREVSCYSDFGSMCATIEKDVIRITYQDGSYELMGADGVYYIKPDGNTVRGISFVETDFRKFMYKCVDESFGNI